MSGDAIEIRALRAEDADDLAASGDVLRLQRPAVPATSLPLATPGGEEALAACLADTLE
jgi:hypothetical protein